MTSGSLILLSIGSWLVEVPLPIPPWSLTYNPLGHAAIGETYSTDTDLRLRCGNVGTLL